MRKPASEYDLLPLPSSLKFQSIALTLTHARGRACKPRRVREQRLGRLFTHNTHKHRRARPSYLQLFILDLLPKQADREKKEKKKTSDTGTANKHLPRSLVILAFRVGEFSEFATETTPLYPSRSHRHHPYRSSTPPPVCFRRFRLFLLFSWSFSLSI